YGIFRQEFQRDAAAQADIFRFIYHSHAALAELGQDSVVRDSLAHQSRLGIAGFNQFPRRRYEVLRCHIQRRRFEKELVVLVMSEQCHDLQPKALIARTSLLEVLGPPALLDLESGMEDPVDLPPAFGLHRPSRSTRAKARPLPVSSPASPYRGISSKPR